MRAPCEFSDEACGICLPCTEAKLNDTIDALTAAREEVARLKWLVETTMAEKECPWCTKVSRSGEHDANCDGLRALASTPRGGAAITREEVQAALQRGAKAAMEMGQRIAETFSLPTQQHRLDAAAPVEGAKGADELDFEGNPRIYPCALCPTMRSKPEGGTVFTVCDECWDKEHPRASDGKGESE